MGFCHTLSPNPLPQQQELFWRDVNNINTRIDIDDIQELLTSIK
jgi:hypothetical protein